MASNAFTLVNALVSLTEGTLVVFLKSMTLSEVILLKAYLPMDDKVP